jgi:putative FmdB family regulatory protein
LLEEPVVPTYDYRCDRCDRTFEVRQRISESPLTTCDRCGGPIHRLLSPAPFILKGGGWYVTDYPSEGRKKGMAAEKSSGDSSSSSSASSAGSASSSTSSSTSTSTDSGAAAKSDATAKPSPTPSS